MYLIIILRYMYCVCMLAHLSVCVCKVKYCLLTISCIHGGTVLFDKLCHKRIPGAICSFKNTQPNQCNQSNNTNKLKDGPSFLAISFQ